MGGVGGGMYIVYCSVVDRDSPTPPCGWAGWGVFLLYTVYCSVVMDAKVK